MVTKCAEIMTYNYMRVLWRQGGEGSDKVTGNFALHDLLVL